MRPRGTPIRPCLPFLVVDSHQRSRFCLHLWPANQPIFEYLVFKSHTGRLCYCVTITFDIAFVSASPSGRPVSMSTRRAFATVSTPVRHRSQVQHVGLGIATSHCLMDGYEWQWQSIDLPPISCKASGVRFSMRSQSSSRLTAKPPGLSKFN